MQVQVHTDTHIEGTEAMAKWAAEEVQVALSRVAAQISRVEVHFSDENGGKKSQPEVIQCTLEVRIEGLAPLAVKDTGSNLKQSLSGATDKALRAVDHAVARARG